MSSLILWRLVIISLEEAGKTLIKHGTTVAQERECTESDGNTWTHLQQQQPSLPDGRGPFKDLLGVERGSCFIQAGAKWTRSIPLCLRPLHFHGTLNAFFIFVLKFKIDLVRCIYGFSVVELCSSPNIIF